MGSWLRIGVGFVYMAVATVVHGLLMLLLLPWRGVRIRSCNLWGWVTGRFCMWLSGSSLEVHGAGNLSGDRPVIYVSNHTSMLDIFLGIWLAPLGTVGVAKKEVVYYPFFGQLYWLSGHLRLDRGHHGRALEAMRELVRIVARYRLSIWMWPEGTRSRDGRLLPFKKGIWHLACATGLPVVPVVVSGAHQAWEKGSMRLRPTHVTVEVLPAIDTSGWATRDADEVVQELHDLFEARLPPAQRSLRAAA
ncbi:MAG: 1-acyl-sn-glycerol-3-phosphate acyltransferase [Alphaproteobacteria bacterium]|nr:1-acyl-sn-glycerol-3-phosphate acyltransferase [Alphaproteobacteria bacterium]